MGIQSKILSVVGAMMLIVVLLTTLLISQRAQTLSKNLSLQAAEESAKHYGIEVKSALESALSEAKLLEASFWQLRTENVRREVLDKILKKNTEMNKNILGSWMLWEPNAFDGKDNDYKNTKGHDSTGRVNSFWHWLADDVVLEPNVDWQTSGWYQNPKKRLKETLEDPYFYTVSGEEMLLISSIQPIVHNEKFHGVVGIDLKLDMIQNLVESLKVLNSGYSTLIANNGMYVAHPNKSRIGKNINEFESDKDLLTSTNSKNKFKPEFDKVLKTMVYRLPVKVDIANANSSWILMITLPVEKVMAPAIIIRNEIFFTGLVSAVIMLFLLTFLVRSLLAPILAMTNLLKIKSDAKLAVFPHFDITSHDEIGELASSFNQMSLEVNQSRNQLEKLNIELSVFNEQLEQRVLRKTQKLLESEKMASLGRLVTGVSHELNTPVGICVTALSFLHDQLTPNSGATRAEINENLCLLSENINKVSSLINSLKLLSISSSAEEKTAFFCRELIETTANSVRSQFSASHIDIIIKGEDIEIHSFPNALSQAVSHIISNSIIHAFKSEQGQIKEDTITIALLYSENIVTIVCEDNGVGMSEKMTDKIFEAFSTRHLGSTGKGLGMNIVYNVVTQTLRGNIECKSEPEKGTRYDIQFPR